LSLELRTHKTPDLTRRRWLVSLSMVGAAAGAIVGLYQMGVFRRLPDFPVGPFDATKVDASDYGYKRLQTRDGFLMIASYATTAILAAAGGEQRVRDMPVLPLVLAAKVLYDVGIALKFGQEEWSENKALCGYCQTATVASIVSLALAMPEAIAATRRLRSGRAHRSHVHRNGKASRTAKRRN
jgi:Vitamin K epoxide reductase family